MLQITALMDDKPPKDSALLSEHGLSFFVQCHNLRLLFDCGMTDAAQQNARTLSIDLRNLDGVILSHSHYDHAGGFRSLAEQDLQIPILYTGPGFFRSKFAWKEGQLRDLSCGFDLGFLKEHAIAHREITGAVQIHPGVWLISGFPRVHEFETIPDRFVLKTASGLVHDAFSDEVCMALEVEGGLAVLVGCSHPGILNMVGHVRTAMGQPVWAVFGGTHLVEADGTRIQVTVKGLKDMGLELLGLCHCTGEGAVSAIAAMPDVKSCYLAAGDSITLEEREEYCHVTESGCQ